MLGCGQLMCFSAKTRGGHVCLRSNKSCAQDESRGHLGEVRRLQRMGTTGLSLSAPQRPLPWLSGAFKDGRWRTNRLVAQRILCFGLQLKVFHFSKKSLVQCCKINPLAVVVLRTWDAWLSHRKQGILSDSLHLMLGSPRALHFSQFLQRHLGLQAFQFWLSHNTNHSSLLDAHPTTLAHPQLIKRKKLLSSHTKVCWWNPPCHHQPEPTSGLEVGPTLTK